MRALIKKILREERKIPKWFSDWEKLPTEGRIEGIENRKKHFQRKIPKIVEFFSLKFGNDLDHIKIGEEGVHYGHENYSTEVILLEFYFNNVEFEHSIRKDIYSDLKNFFGIDLEYYGMPMHINFYVKKWKKF